MSVVRRIIASVSTLLVVAGLALLAYVAVSYVHSKPVTAQSWSAAEKQKGEALRSQLVHHQVVYIPRALAGAKLPPPGMEGAARIVIPRIGVDSPVVQTAPTLGVWDVADWAVGHLSTTPNPGAIGNGAYSAHDDIKGEIFKRLAELRPGNRILLYTKHAVYTYVVVSQRNVDPSDISVLNPTPKVSTVTLISCVPYWVDTQRIIVQGVFKSRLAIH